MATASKDQDEALRRALLGNQPHGKRNLYGHWFRDGRCTACNLTKIELSKRFERREASRR